MTELTTEHIEQEYEPNWMDKPLSFALRFDWEKTLYLLFIILALVSRLWGVGDRVVSHDESLHTQYSYQYYIGDGYQHTPLMHGPFLFHATALSYWLFGDNDFAARVPVALLGVFLVVMPYALRNWIGRVGALTASFLFLISPYLTYYSRYIRHDIYIIVWAMIIFIATWHYLQKPKDSYLAWFAAGMALMFVTKEVSYIYVAIFGSALLIRLFTRLFATYSFKEMVGKASVPLLILLLGVGVAGAGVVMERGSEAETAVSESAEESGFSADPDADIASAETEGGLGGWLQSGGILIAMAGLFYLVIKWEDELRIFPEFDITVLYVALLLPTITALPISLTGHDPQDYVFDTSNLFSGLGFSLIWVFAFLIVGIALGLWWNQNKFWKPFIIFHVIFLVFYTSIFTNPNGWNTGMLGSLGYWLVQQDVKRGSQPWFYYGVVTPMYEFLPIILSYLAIRLWATQQNLFGLIRYWTNLFLLTFLTYSFVSWFFTLPDNIAPFNWTNGRFAALTAGLVFLVGLASWAFVYSQHTRTRLSGTENEPKRWRELLTVEEVVGFVPTVTWWLILTWVAYSIAGEKMPWLSTHFVIPMAILGGWYLNELFKEEGAKQLLSPKGLGAIGLSAVFIVAIFFAISPLLFGTFTLGDTTSENLREIGRFLGYIVAAFALYYYYSSYRSGYNGIIKRNALHLGFFALLAILTIRFTMMSSFFNHDKANEFMVYAHGAPATKSQVLEQLEELSVRLHGDKSIQVAYDDRSSWPYTWYLRDYPNRVFVGANASRDLEQYPVVLAGRSNFDAFDRFLSRDFTQTEHIYIWWPMEEYRKLGWGAFTGYSGVPIPEGVDAPDKGIANAKVRRAIWDIFMYRDYEQYGEVFGGDYSDGEWPLRDDLRLYIRNDVLAQVWDHGVVTSVLPQNSDPYAENEFMLQPDLVIGTEGQGLGQVFGPRNVAVGLDGRIYVADSDNHRIQIFDSNGNSVGAFGSNGSAPEQFNQPWGLAVDDQFIYVADTWNHRIQKFTLDGVFVSSFGISGSPAAGESGDGLFFGPRDITLLPDNRLAISDTGNHRIQVFDRDGNYVDQIGENGFEIGQMSEPVGLATDSTGSVIYLLDTWNSRVQSFAANQLLPLPSFDIQAWSGNSINNKPYMATDSEGRLFITDPEAFQILIFDPQGGYIGRFGRFSEGADGLNMPTGIAIDANDNIFITDAANHHVLRFASPFK